MTDTSNAASKSAHLPVRAIPTDPVSDSPVGGIALCLSGGGYRAMLFHLGAIWRLYEFGLLGNLDRISSVSGGSIAAAVLALNWVKLKQNGSVECFRKAVVQPIMGIAGRTVDVPAILSGLILPGGVGRRIAHYYRKYLFGRASLQDFPNTPLFVLNSTNVQSGVLWRFSRPFMRDYRVGKIQNPQLEVSVAVAASSAFPPVLSPVLLRLKDSEYVPATGLDLQKPPFTTRVILTDGGVYDNLGLETAYKKYKTILVSDGGARMQPERTPKKNWISHAVRVLGVIDNQVGSLRKRGLIASFDANRREGAYWGIGSDMANYGTSGALLCPNDKTSTLAAVPTRLKALDLRLQKRLINWGYAICDAAVRRHYDCTLPQPQGFPYPEAGVG